MPSATVNRVAMDAGMHPDQVQKVWTKHAKVLEDEGRSRYDQSYWPMLVSRVKDEVSRMCSKKMGWKCEGLSRAATLILDTLIEELLEEEYDKSTSTVSEA